MSDQPVYVCKECVFAKVSFIDRVSSLFGPLPVHPYSYYCTRPKPRVKFSGKELVVGANTREEPCINQREDFYGRDDICGPEGKYWSPKKKTSENLIKFMRK